MLLQRLRNRFSYFSSIPLLLGAGMELLGNYLPNTGWPWVTPLLAQVLSIVGFIFIAIALGAIVVGFLKTPAITPSSKLENIVLTIEKMDSLLREQALKEAKKSYDKEKYLEVHNRINANATITEAYGGTKTNLG